VLELNKTAKIEEKPLCQYFLAGGCRFGSSCRYRHPGQGGREIPQICNTKRATKFQFQSVLCGCTESKASPPRRTRKESHCSEYLATVVGLDREMLSRRMKSFIRGKSSLPAHLVFPDSGAALSLMTARGGLHFDADPLGKSNMVLIGKQPYASSATSDQPQAITRVIGTIEHARCVLRWLERTFGIVFLAFSRETSAGQLKGMGWGLRGFIAPFHIRLAGVSAPAPYQGGNGHVNKDGLDNKDRALFREIISSYARSESLSEEDEDADASEDSFEELQDSGFQAPLPAARMDFSKLDTYPVIGETKAYRAVMPKDQREAVETFLQSGKRQQASDIVAWSHFTATGPESALDSAQLTKSYERVLSGPSAGCSIAAQLSEALSAELLERAFGARVTHAEMDLKYRTNEARRLDYRCLVGPGPSKLAVGVSVTRAVASRDLRATRSKGEPFTRKHAKKLIKRKVAAIASARRNVHETASFQRALLHVWCSSELVAQMVDAEARALAKESDNEAIWRDVVVWATVTDFGGVNLRYAYIFRT